MAHTNEMVLAKVAKLYEELFRHNGFGEMRIEIRILKRGQKEVIIHCGKQYRFVVDYPAESSGTPVGAGPTST
ncbi:hypothetical protein [Desulfothermobacter acidiphilus]|uniref:hypothetical protein n=1 Tax=Desulfothermobacter acidiphilus TaxID=1938353 RepID=UPI003F89FA4B